MVQMAVAVKKLDVQLGDVVEIDGRRYDIVPDKEGGVALEPAITMSHFVHSTCLFERRHVSRHLRPRERFHVRSRSASVYSDVGTAVTPSN